jgi:hypothetical protein
MKSGLVRRFVGDVNMYEFGETVYTSRLERAGPYGSFSASMAEMSRLLLLSLSLIKMILVYGDVYYHDYTTYKQQDIRSRDEYMNLCLFISDLEGLSTCTCQVSR